MLFKISGGVALTVLFALGCGGGGNSPQTLVQSPQENIPVENSSAIQQLVNPVNSETPYSNLFDDDRLLEVSGLQRSGSLNGVYYAHNDSGHDSSVFVTDAEAQVLGVVSLSDVQAVDWEAIAGVRIGGVPHIVVGDIGNNSEQRSDLSLLVFEEPDFSQLPVGFDIEVSSRRIDISYADGRSYDAEAFFIDGDNDTVVILTKSERQTDSQSMWRGSLTSGLTNTSLVLEFRGLVALTDIAGVNSTTDIDIHPNSRELALLTYGAIPFTGMVHIWSAGDSEGTADALTRAADKTVAVMPIGLNFQAEAISYSPEGSHLLIGAESLAESISTLTVISP